MRQAVRKTVLGAVHTAARMLGTERAARLLGEALGRQFLMQTVHAVRSGDKAIRFYALGELAQWRVQTFFSKEPETLAWLDTISSDEVVWDIGANMGLYSLYAAVVRGCRVLSFEPSAANYFLLNRSIELNGVGDRVQAYCLALADADLISVLNMTSTELAGAHSTFAEATDAWGRPFKPSFTQGMTGYSIDSFIAKFTPPFPNHLKVDVDGIEDKVVAGAALTLRDPRLKSVSIEIEEGRGDATIISAMREAGLKLSEKHQSEGSFHNCHFRRV